MVGVMCVMTDGELDKSQYRKFIIKNFDSSNDTGALKEVLSRRLSHMEWRMPDIIVIDGGIAQLNAANEVVKNFFAQLAKEYPEKYPDAYTSSNILGSETPIVISVVKNDAHKAREILYTGEDEILIKETSNSVSKLITPEKIIELNAETHRFAITFHKKKRGESFLPKRSTKK